MPLAITEIRDHATLLRFLREFTNGAGDVAPYDFVYAFQMLEALLDNLARHHLDADIESLAEGNFRLTSKQLKLLEKLSAFSTEHE